MTRPKRRLPGLLAEIADVVGEDAAIAIAEAKGGFRAHFPRKVTEDHWLVAAVGRQVADRLCKHFAVGEGGVLLHVPLGPAGFYGQARRRALSLRASGTSISNTARLVGVSTRTVEKWVAEARSAGSNQPFGLATRPREAGAVRPSPDKLYGQAEEEL